jgi:hypothetical protein
MREFSFPQCKFQPGTLCVFDERHFRLIFHPISMIHTEVYKVEKNKIEREETNGIPLVYRKPFEEYLQNDAWHSL